MGLALSPGLKSLGGGSTRRPCGKCEAVLGDFVTSPGGVPGVKSLGARGRHRRGGPGGATSSDVPSLWQPLPGTS